MLAQNPTRLDADLHPSTRRSALVPSPAAQRRPVTMREAHDHTKPQPLLSLIARPETNQMLDHTADECVSTPKIGNRRRETGSQGHGVNLVSRKDGNTPTGPANTCRAIHLVTECTW